MGARFYTGQFFTGKFWLSKTWLADSALLFVAVTWGASYAVAKGTLVVTPVLSLIFFRFLIAALLLLPVCVANLRRATKTEALRAVFLGCILTCIFLAETFGVFFTSATNAAFIISLCIVFTPILDAALVYRFPPLAILGCAALALFGTGLMVINEAAISFNFGDLLILCAACLRAVMVISTKRLFVSQNISSSTLTFIQFSTVVVLSGALIVATQGATGLLPIGNAVFWAGLLFLSVFCTLAAFFIQNWAVRRTNPTRVGFLMGTEPIFGGLFAVMLLSEGLTYLGVIGAGFILIGTLTGARFSNRVRDNT